MISSFLCFDHDNFPGSIFRFSHKPNPSLQTKKAVFFQTYNVASPFALSFFDPIIAEYVYTFIPGDYVEINLLSWFEPQHLYLPYHAASFV